MTIKKKIEKKNIGLKKLMKTWKSVSPLNNISHSNQRSLILLSENDKEIYYKYGLELVTAMQRKNINVKVNKNTIFGHYISLSAQLIAQLIFPRRIIEFLED